MLRDVGSGLRSRNIAEGVRLHVHSPGSFKTTRIDLFVQNLLRPVDNTRIALLGRLLERGTQRLPDMQRLNRFVDHLYGAVFASEVDQFGEHQVIHLSLEVPDRRFLGSGEDLLRPGLEFISEVLRFPVQEAGGFPRDVVRQEKTALAQYIASHFDDRMNLALRRCAEHMCAGEPYSLSPLGAPEDFGDIDACDLLRFHFEILAERPIDLFISGSELSADIEQLVGDLFSWERRGVPASGITRPVIGIGGAPPKTYFESETLLQQGKLAVGFRTDIHIADEAYPALLLFDLLFGGDAHSRLYRTVRERSGLCYQVGTYLEPLCGLMFLEAGVDLEDVDNFLSQVVDQMHSLARSGPIADELERAKALAIRRLWSLEDDREGLVRFWYQRGLASAESRSKVLERAIESVTPAQVRDVASGVSMDTVYCFHNARSVRRHAGS